MEYSRTTLKALSCITAVLVILAVLTHIKNSDRKSAVSNKTDIINIQEERHSQPDYTQYQTINVEDSRYSEPRQPQYSNTYNSYTKDSELDYYNTYTPPTYTYTSISYNSYGSSQQLSTHAEDSELDYSHPSSISDNNYNSTQQLSTHEPDNSSKWSSPYTDHISTYEPAPIIDITAHHEPPTVITSCDNTGCWDNSGSRYTRNIEDTTSTYFQSGRACQMINGVMQCL